MGCNLGNSRSRLDAGASRGAFGPLGVSYKLPRTLADGSVVPIDGGSAFILYASLVLSSAIQWAVIAVSCNLSADCKMNY